MRAAWLSLDEGDSDLTRFLAYLIAALQTVAADIGKGVLGMLHSPQLPPIETILTTLLNEIATIPEDFILILDDYHVIDAKPVDDALDFLVEHLPWQLHLVISTREDPQLPLARLRARGQLTELRAADLRFTPAEAAEFLNRVMGLNLLAEEVAALEARTEGWIAGLQMAALSMQGRSDTAGFIKSFTGSHRFVLDYLVEEVLQQQREHVRSFLLQTAILDRLSGPLCDAVTGREDGKEMLEALERGNLFVVPLDDRRQWYRYHHLFAEVLGARLKEEQPDQDPSLHRRASAWYEQNGLPADAIHHALAAGDFERAARLIELANPDMDVNIHPAAWLSWMRALPDDLIRARPVLSVGYAWALLDCGEMEAAEARLRDAERWLEAAATMGEQSETPSKGMVVVDEEQFRSLPASIATARAYHVLALGDVPGAVKHARQALKLTPEEDHYRRLQIVSLLGLAQYASGDLAGAERSLADFLANMRKAGDSLTEISVTFLLTDIRMALGRLNDAVSTLQQVIQLAAAQGEPMPLGTSDLFRGISELYCERGDLEAAAQHLLRGRKLGEQRAVPDWPYRLCVTEARIKEAQGDLDGALGLLDEAERVHIRGPLPDVHPTAALKTRVWIRQGRLPESFVWGREQGLSADDNLSYLREFEHITLARVLIAQYKNGRVDGAIHQALGLLERLLKTAEEGGRMGSVIEILVLLSLAHEAQDNIPLACLFLERALTLAEPEGYSRLFVGEGLPMKRLLQEVAAGGIASEYARRLLAAFPSIEVRQVHAAQSALVDPLSERELEVLHHIAAGRTNQEIAARLYLSLNTVKVHTRNIFSKLGAHHRADAVARARALGILHPN
jgi:LuxR family maltose regulon positive regulatory protein